jgi:putative phosphoribosyl transferase
MNRYKNILKNRKDAAEKLLDVIPTQKLKDEQWNIIEVSKGALELASYL